MQSVEHVRRHADVKEAQDALEVGGRLSESPASQMIAHAFSEELRNQRALSVAIGFVDIAYVLGLVKAGIVARSVGRELLSALIDLHEHPSALELDASCGDLYTNREAWLMRRTSAAGWLGAGRARREATTAAFQLAVCDEVLDFVRALIGVGRQLVDMAATHQNTLVADYTYLQSAQPTTFGHYVLGFVYPALRDVERARAFYARVNRSPVGCGSTNGSRLAPGRSSVAGMLGFDGIVAHARDAMWQADLPIEGMALVVAGLVNLSRLAEDLMVFATEEFGVVELCDVHARASKIMPQKKNPFSLAYVRSAANQAIGAQAALAASGRTPTGQMDSRMLCYGELPRLLKLATGATEVMHAVLGGLSVSEDNAARTLRSFVAATDLAETLVLETGMDYRAAHRLVGHIARTLRVDHRAADTLMPEDVASAGLAALGMTVTISSDVLARALDPRVAVASRTAAGGAAAAPMAEMIAECRRMLDQGIAWQASMVEHAQRVRAELLAAARQSIGEA